MKEKTPYITDISSISVNVTRVIKLEGDNSGKAGTVTKVNRSSKMIEVKYDDDSMEEAGFYDFGFEPESRSRAA